MSKLAKDEKRMFLHFRYMLLFVGLLSGFQAIVLLCYVLDRCDGKTKQSPSGGLFGLLSDVVPSVCGMG